MASLAGMPLARLAGALDPQWYVLGPGLGLFVTGLALPRGARGAAGEEGRATRVITGRWLAAAGCLLFVGTSALQTLAGHRLGAQGLPAGIAVTLLVAEGIISILVGVALRRRVPVVGGALATVVGGMWSLAVAAREVPLFVYFAVLGVILLGTATLLLRNRDRLGVVRKSFESSWRDWR